MLINWRTLLHTSAAFALPTPVFEGGGYFFRVGENKTISHWDQSVSDSKFLFRKLNIRSARQKSGRNVSRILRFGNLNPLPAGGRNSPSLESELQAPSRARRQAPRPVPSQKLEDRSWIFDEKFKKTSKYSWFWAIRISSFTAVT